MSKKYLSYNTVTTGEKCEKAFYLSVNHPELKDVFSEERKVLLNQSREIKIKARELFPGGIKIERDTDNLESAVKDTLTLLQSGATIIYEAVFIYKGIFVVIDILILENGIWKFFEVKNSLRISYGYFKELAFSYLALKNAIQAIPEAYLITINNHFVLHNNSNFTELFQIQNVTSKIMEFQVLTDTKIEKANRLEKNKTCPEVKIGNQCVSPYECDFIKYCWKEIPEESILKVNGIPFSKRMDLYNSGINVIQDMKGHQDIPLLTRNQIDSTLEKKEVIDKKKLMPYLAKMRFPVLLFDMEFLSSAVPKISGTRPFEQIPFAFTSFLVDSGLNKIEEINFVSEPNQTMESDLIMKLLPVLVKCESIMVYDKGMEMAWIKKIKKDSSQIEFIKAINKPVIDLYEPIRKGYYYHYLMQGKYSLKQVYKAITKKNFNDNKLVASGLIASQTYQSLFSENDPHLRQTIIEQLKEYSRADVEALFQLMLRLFHIQELEMPNLRII